MSSIKRFIFIPVVNHFELLETAINSVPPGLFDEYFIFNNSGKQLHIDTKHFTTINDTRKTFMQTQNIMRKYAIDNGYNYYCFMHNDGEALDDSARRLVEYTDNLVNNNDKWGIVYTTYDVLCSYSTKCATEIGEWGDIHWLKDQQSGYYLDNDYYRRIKLSGYVEYNLPHSNVLHTEHSNTIKSPLEHTAWDTQVKLVEANYIKKWGGMPGNEIYTIPYNLTGAHYSHISQY